MVTTATQDPVLSLHFEKEVQIEAPVEVVFESVLAELGPEGQMPDGSPFPMKIEAWPGGRWYRDLGNNAGHLWGHVQVIKPPTLLEICGPLFMSYAATNHVQYRLTPEGNATRLRLIHRGVGQIASDVFEGVQEGWGFSLRRIEEIAARLRAQR